MLRMACDKAKIQTHTYSWHIKCILVSANGIIILLHSIVGFYLVLLLLLLLLFPPIRIDGRNDILYQLAGIGMFFERRKDKRIWCMQACM